MSVALLLMLMSFTLVKSATRTSPSGVCLLPTLAYALRPNGRHWSTLSAAADTTRATTSLRRYQWPNGSDGRGGQATVSDCDLFKHDHETDERKTILVILSF